MKVTNTTGKPFEANVAGQFFQLEPDASVRVDDRTALILGEYGLEIADRQAAILGQDAVVTVGERRLTEGRQHVSDDPRANVPGTPVEVTGDTGATDPGKVLTDPSVTVGNPGDEEPALVTAAADLKGEALDDAVREWNDGLAEDNTEDRIASSLTADEKRAELAERYGRQA